MKTLYDNGGRYVVVDNGCPGLKLYDKLLQRIAFSNAAYYDDMHGDGKTALDYASAAADRLKSEPR